MANDPNDKIVREWAERNGMEGFLIGDLRTALNDARSIPELAALQQAQQPGAQAVAWPSGLLDRVKAAEQRIENGHAPRRIPADPSDVDLVLAEVRCLLERSAPPFWLKSEATAPPPLPLEPEPDLDERDPKSGELVAQWLFRNGFHELAAVVRAQLDMRAPRKAPPPLPEGVSEEDVEAAWTTWTTVRGSVAMREILENFLARLAARGEKGVQGG